MLSKSEKDILLSNSRMIYTKYMALDVMRNKNFCKISNTSSNSTLFDVCLEYLKSNSYEPKEVLIGGKVFNLIRQHGTSNIKISRATNDAQVVVKQLDAYSDTDSAALLFDQTFTFQKMPNEKWDTGILLKDGTVLGGPNKLQLYRTHLLALYNIIQKISSDKLMDKNVLLAALPTGSGKTFIQALWLHVLYLSGQTAIFTMPPNLIPQFRKDMNRLLPSDVVDKITILKEGDSQALTKAIEEGNKIIVTSSDNLLGDDCFHSAILHDNKPVFVSFDEQHKTTLVNRADVRRKILADKHPSLYLTATPTKKTYLDSGKAPIAKMSPAQKQQAGQGGLPLVKTINTKFDVDLNRKYTPFRNFKKFFINELHSIIAGIAFPFVSSASREALDYLPYQICYKPGDNPRWDIQMPMATKMLWVIDDNESLVNFFHRFNSDYICDTEYYHNGVLQHKNPGKCFGDEKQIELDKANKVYKSLVELYKENLFDSQTKGMSQEDKDKYLQIAGDGLKAQVKENMFHYLIEYVLMDITSLTQIELNDLRKKDLTKLQKIVQDYYSKTPVQDKSYFIKKLQQGKIGIESATIIASLLPDIASTLKKLSLDVNCKQEFKNFCDNSFIDKSLYKQVCVECRGFKWDFASYVEKYQVVAVMANMEGAETPVADSKPFNKLQKTYDTNKKPKKRKRSSIEKLAIMMGDNNTPDNYFEPEYFDNIKEEEIDELFDKGFIGILASNKKSIGANFKDLHTVVCINESQLTENSNPAMRKQIFGRLRGLDPHMQPVFIDVFGYKIKPYFDLNLLSKVGDYYPKYFRSQESYNKKQIKVLGKSLGDEIIKAYYEALDDAGVVNYSLLKLKTLKLIAKTFRQLNINNNFDTALSKAQLTEVIIGANACVNEEIYNLKNPYEISLSIKILMRLFKGFFSLFNGITNIFINKNLAKHAKNIAKDDSSKNSDRIYLKIIKSKYSLGDFSAASLTMVEFANWALQIKDRLLFTKDTTFFKDIYSIYKEYTDTNDFDAFIMNLLKIKSYFLKNFDFITRLVIKYFSPLLFHSEMIKNIEMFMSDLSKEDLLHLCKLNMIQSFEDKILKEIESLEKLCKEQSSTYLSQAKKEELNTNISQLKLKLVNLCKCNNVSSSEEDISNSIERLVDACTANDKDNIVSSKETLVSLSKTIDTKIFELQASKAIDMLFEFVDKIRKKDIEGLLRFVKSICFDSIFPILNELTDPLVTYANPQNRLAVMEIFNLFKFQDPSLLPKIQEFIQNLGLANLDESHKNDLFDKIVSNEPVSCLSILISIPSLIQKAKYDSLSFYDSRDLMGNKFFDNIKDKSKFLQTISEPLKGDNYHRSYREGESAISTVLSMIKATKRLSNIKASANIDVSSGLENINENVLKGVWWKLKVSIWRHSLERLVTNILFAIKEVALYLWKGIKSVKNKIVTFVYRGMKINDSQNDELKFDDKYYSVNDFTTKINKSRAFTNEEATKRGCPEDSVQPILDELDDAERKLPSFGA